MFTPDRLGLLNERKQRLLNEAEVQRKALVTDCEVVRGQLEWVDEAFKVARTVAPFFTLLTSLVRANTTRKCASGIRIVDEILRMFKNYGNAKL